MKVFITGANRGIGLGFVQAYLARGNSVIACYRDATKIKELMLLKEQYNTQLQLEKFDISKEADFIDISKKYAQTSVDVLINNAGIYPETHSQSGLAKSNPSDLLHAFETNAVGPFRVIQVLLSALLRSSKPRVINMSSQMGALSAAKGFGYSYRMSKVALNMLTRCFAEENSQVITISIRPGWVKTDMGGSNADLEVSYTVNKMVSLIDELDKTDSGKFLDYNKVACDW